MEKRQAKQEAEKQRRAAKRRLDPEAEPCSACGNWDHERRSSKSCPYYLPPRKDLTPLKRTSVIKTGLNNCCRNDRLKQIIQETVITSRNLTYVASLFMEYLVVNRLSNNLPIPPLNQTFCYNVFCQLINRGSRAPDWVKTAHQQFSHLIPQSISASMNKCTKLVTVTANEYATNAVNHIVANFEKKSREYFFCRFSDQDDDWYLRNSSVNERKRLSQYAYDTAAAASPEWPTTLKTSVSKASIDTYASTVQLGPTPINDSSLSAKAHLYLPWMFKVLQRLEQKVFIKEPKAQSYVTRGYIYRHLKEVECRNRLYHASL